MSKPTILIIEDNATTRKLLRIALETEQYNVLEAPDGKTALEQAKKNPDLILQDLILPDMDGLTLNRQLRAIPGLHEIPILALSGFLNRMEELHTSETGFTAFLVKPIEIPHLLEVVEAYLPSQRAISAQTGSGKRLLLVDDNVAQLKFLKLQLANLGFDVVTVKSGQEALETIGSQKIDAVVSDVLMPHMDGFELCLAIRRNPKTYNLPVILLTANYLEEADRALARRVSANDFLTRTSNLKELLNALETAFISQTPILYPEPVDFFKEEHTHRLIRQLEKQIINNTGLAQQSALQASQLSLLGGVADALTNSTSIEQTLQDVLTTCLDIAGISKGAFYLRDNNQGFTLNQMIGYSSKEEENVRNLFCFHELFDELIRDKAVIQIPSTELDEKKCHEFLKQADISSALIIPLICQSECSGALFLGSNTTNVTDSGPITFAHALGTQLGQAVALATAFEHVAASEQRYRSLVDNASCGIFVTNQKNEIIEINKRGEILLNADKKFILGKKLIDFILSEDRPYVESQLIKLLEHKTIELGEFRMVPMNHSSVRNVEVMGVEVKLPKETLLLMVITDVTERNQLRTQALLNDKLVTVGTLTAGIAHEINNPITSIIANLSFLTSHLASFKNTVSELQKLTGNDVLLKDKMEQLNKFIAKQENERSFEKFNDAINDATEAAKHMQDIVLDLKSFARTDTAETVAINLNDVLKTAITMANPIIKNHAMLNKELASDIPLLKLNKGKLHQVFLNLLVNAAQSIPQGQTDKNQIGVVSKIEGQSIRIDISDSGSGIPPELLSKIFDPFFTTKAAGSGTGLGLTICREIINKFGGDITVESTVGKGTTFSVFLPLQLKASDTIKTAMIEESEDAPIIKKSLLLIDDEPLLVKGLQRILETFHDVMIAGGGKEALDIITKNNLHFDVIVCDLNMPEINGADIYRFIAEHYPGREKDIIFVSGGVYTQNLMDFMAKIDNKHLEKPFPSSQILKLINEFSKKI